MRPIVWIPGVGGSQLVRKGQEYKTVLGHRVPDNRWFSLHHLTLTNLSQWKKELGVDLVREPHTHKVTGLRRSDPSIVPLDVGGLRGIRDVVGDFEMLPRAAREWLNYWYSYQYFGPAIDAVQRHVPKAPMLGLPYDIRLVLDGRERRALFRQWKREIERACEGAAGQSVVVVAHSLGAVLFKWFASSSVVDRTWLDNYVSRFVSVSAPYGGSPLAMRVLCTGDHYVPMYRGIFREEMQKFSGLVMCMPNHFAFDREACLLELENGYQLSINTMHELARIGHPSFGIYEDLWVPNLNEYAAPVHVRTDVFMAAGEPTPVMFSSKQLEDIPKTTKQADGDGIVPMSSLLACDGMFTHDITRDVVLRDTNHTRIISHPTLMSHLVWLAQR